jgi:hypothetical protein
MRKVGASPRPSPTQRRVTVWLADADFAEMENPRLTPRAAAHSGPVIQWPDDDARQRLGDPAVTRRWEFLNPNRDVVRLQTHGEWRSELLV